MTTFYKRILIAAVALVLVAAAACALVLSGGCSTTKGSALDTAKNDALNTVIDASGIKDKAESALRGKASELAQEMGVPQSIVDNTIDNLAIPDWQATTLPESATETGTYSAEVDGTEVELTTYDDPTVVTVSAYGQDVTMELPESAQSYVALLSYLDYLQ